MTGSFCCDLPFFLGGTFQVMSEWRLSSAHKLHRRTFAPALYAKTWQARRRDRLENVKYPLVVFKKNTFSRFETLGFETIIRKTSDLKVTFETSNFFEICVSLGKLLQFPSDQRMISTPRHVPRMKTSWSDWNLRMKVPMFLVSTSWGQNQGCLNKVEHLRVKHAKAKIDSIWQQLSVAQHFFPHLFLTYGLLCIACNSVGIKTFHRSHASYSSIPWCPSLPWLSSLETVASIAEEPHTGYLRFSANAIIFGGWELARKPYGTLWNFELQINCLLFLEPEFIHTHTLTLHPKCKCKNQHAI